MKHIAQKNKNKAFTLIELLIVIAIIGILAAIVLVSLSGSAKNARATKALAQLSSMFPNIVSCLGNGGSIATNKPANGEQGGGDICSIDGTSSTSYGQWVLFNGDLAGYYYGDSVFTSSRQWYLRAYSQASYDNVGICCNSTMGGCKIIGASGSQSTCIATSPSN